MSIVRKYGMAAAIQFLVLMQSDRAASRADRAGTHDHIVDAVHQQVAAQQPCVEQVRFEGDDGLNPVVFGSMNRVPAEIGADIDEDPA